MTLFKEAISGVIATLICVRWEAARLLNPPDMAYSAFQAMRRRLISNLLAPKGLRRKPRFWQ